MPDVDNNRIDLEPAASLADSMWEREALLHSKGIKSFSPYLRFLESFSENDADLQEYRSVRILASKAKILTHPNSYSEFLQSIKSAPWRASETGKPWEKNLSRIEMLRDKLSFTDRGHFLELKKPYLDEEARLLNEEVLFFPKGNASAMTDAVKGVNRINLYKNIMNDYGKKLGFELDASTMSTPGPHYSKKLTEEYKLFWLADSAAMKKPFDLAPKELVHCDTGLVEVVHPKGAPFSLFLGLRRNHAEKNHRNICLFNFQHLFPITHHYAHFRSLQALEALIFIYLSMYQIIQPELENAFLRGINRSKE